MNHFSILLGLIGLLGVSESGVLTSSIWAVLVAGSNGWDNYRHQADVCHAYHVLVNNGVPKERIIVMMYDDIANNANNQKKGVIINEPNGPNVYEGVNIDYRGDNVTVDTFRNVLLGNKSAVQDRGSGRVLESGRNDHVFINFVDHGSTGMLIFPNENLYAADFLDILKKMRQNEKYGEMIMFIEACEAGSMFNNLLGPFDNILVSTASAPDESSWGCYCDEGTCLGDCYSVQWMNRMEQLNYSESLFEQFDAIRTAILSKSHVNLYGDYRLGFVQFGKYEQSHSNKLSEEEDKKVDIQKTIEVSGVNNRDVPIYLARKEIQNVELQLKHGTIKADAITSYRSKLEKLTVGRKIADNLISRILDSFVRDNKTLKQEIENSRLTMNLNMFGCYKNIVSAFETNCLRVSKHYYILKHLYKFANICLKEMDESQVINAIKTTCNGFNFSGTII